jgi:hypothetical protein
VCSSYDDPTVYDVRITRELRIQAKAAQRVVRRQKAYRVAMGPSYFAARRLLNQALDLYTRLTLG